MPPGRSRVLRFEEAKKKRRSLPSGRLGASLTTSRREVPPVGRSADASRAKPSPSLRRSEEKAQKSAIRQTRSVLESSRREVSPEGRSADASRAKPSPSLRRSEEKVQKSAIRRTRSVLESSRREVSPEGRSADACGALFADRTGALPIFAADLTFCLPKSRPSFAPALSDLVLQNRLRAAGRGSRSESVLRWAGKRQIDPLSSEAESFASKKRRKSAEVCHQADSGSRRPLRPPRRGSAPRSRASLRSPSPCCALSSRPGPPGSPPAPPGR